MIRKKNLQHSKRPKGYKRDGENSKLVLLVFLGGSHDQCLKVNQTLQIEAVYTGTAGAIFDRLKEYLIQTDGWGEERARMRQILFNIMMPNNSDKDETSNVLEPKEMFRVYVFVFSVDCRN